MSPLSPLSIIRVHQPRREASGEVEVPFSVAEGEEDETNAVEEEITRTLE